MKLIVRHKSRSVMIMSVLYTDSFKSHHSFLKVFCAEQKNVEGMSRSNLFLCCFLNHTAGSRDNKTRENTDLLSLLVFIKVDMVLLG